MNVQKDAMINSALEVSSQISGIVDSIQALNVKIKDASKAVKAAKEAIDDKIAVATYTAVMDGTITGKNAEERKLATDAFLVNLKKSPALELLIKALMINDGYLADYQAQHKNLELRLAALKIEQETNIAIMGLLK